MPRLARVIVADNHPLFRLAMHTILAKQADFEVVGEASNGQEALDLSRRLMPDLVLMDVRMPKMDGIAATQALKQELPRTVVLIMTASEEPNHLAEALKAGAAGYVLKTANPQQIINAVRRALEGDAPLNQEVAMQLLLNLMGGQQKEHPAKIAPGSLPVGEGRPGSASPSSLTTQEVKVLQLLARGQSNDQIARNLLVSVSTVKKHVRQIISKLGVSDRVQAAVRAIELDLVGERANRGYTPRRPSLSPTRTRGGMS